MANHNDIGEKGELIAFTYLQEQGYKVLEKNWRFRKDEVDLIVIKDEVLAFVEVKTRTNTYAGDPLQAVTRPKQKRLVRIANEYLKSYRGNYAEVRFDIVGIVLSGPEPQLSHLKDAFYPSL